MSEKVLETIWSNARIFTNGETEAHDAQHSLRATALNVRASGISLGLAPHSMSPLQRAVANTRDLTVGGKTVFSVLQESRY